MIQGHFIRMTLKKETWNLVLDSRTETFPF